MTPPRSPNGIRIKPSSFKIPPDVKAAAQAEAERRGETLTAAVIRLLAAYSKGEH